MSLFSVTSSRLLCRVKFSSLANFSLSRMTKEFDTSIIFWTSSVINVIIHRFSSITSIEKITFLFENSSIFWIMINKLFTNIITSAFSSKTRISSLVWSLLVNVTIFSSNLTQIWSKFNLSFSLNLFSSRLKFKNRSSRFNESLVLVSSRSKFNESLVSPRLEFRINLSFLSRLVIISFLSCLVLNLMNHSIVSHHVKMRLISIFSSRSRLSFLHVQQLRRSSIFKKESYCYKMKSSLKILLRFRSNLV